MVSYVKKIGIILCLLCCIIYSKAQLIPISLDQRIDQSDVILEGKVLSQKSYWDDTHTHIYTSNLIEVYKVFKGNTTSKQVEIITRGGIVGNDMERISHTLELKIGETGIFTTIPNTAKISNNSKLIKLKAYSGQQGFIKYNLETGTAKDVFNVYNKVTSQVHAKITQRTKVNVKTIQKSNLNLQ